jgi:hypothetical protein
VSRVFVCGLGAVSPAGWELASLRTALQNHSSLPITCLPSPSRAQPLRTRAVPPPPARPAFLAHPRLRRTSPITHYAAAAVLEALGSRFSVLGGTAPASPQASSVAQARPRLGLIGCFQSGCVQFSSRFYEETLKDPATASPLAFPETVFAAPTSHLATLLGNVELGSSIIGDPASFLQGLALAAEWLMEERIDLCVVMGAEESHWLTADALWQFQHGAISTSGAGAVCLSRDPSFSIGVELGVITDAHTYSATMSRRQAAQAMRAQLPPGAAGELLCDGLDGGHRTDAAEQEAWENWPGTRVSPKRILGEGLMASAAWQCVIGCDAVARQAASAAVVSVVGGSQQAIGARFLAHAISR